MVLDNKQRKVLFITYAWISLFEYWTHSGLCATFLTVVQTASVFSQSGLCLVAGSYYTRGGGSEAGWVGLSGVSPILGKMHIPPPGGRVSGLLGGWVGC